MGVGAVAVVAKMVGTDRAVVVDVDLGVVGPRAADHGSRWARQAGSVGGRGCNKARVHHGGVGGILLRWVNHVGADRYAGGRGMLITCTGVTERLP